MKDNGFAKAQREYENRMPPEENLMDCPDCEGSGKSSEGMTACCGEAFIDDKTKTCSSCGEISEIADCQRCNGTGSIDADRYAAEQKEEREIDRYEEDKYYDQKQSHSS